MWMLGWSLHLDAQMCSTIYSYALDTSQAHTCQPQKVGMRWPQLVCQLVCQERRESTRPLFGLMQCMRQHVVNETEQSNEVL
jgi:hypothetical protein